MSRAITAHLEHFDTLPRASTFACRWAMYSATPCWPRAWGTTGCLNGCEDPANQGAGRADPCTDQ